MAFIAQLRRRNGEHPAQLTAADYTDCGPRTDAHSGASATDPVCFSRHASSRREKRLVAVASIAAASSAALIAPAFPIARFPQARPRAFGRSKEGYPCPSALGFQLGPQAREDTSWTRSSRGDALLLRLRRSPLSARGPWPNGHNRKAAWESDGPTRPWSQCDAEPSSVSAAWRIVSQSERLPMMMPTSGSDIVPP